MAATNTTANLELSQFVGSDKPDWLTDYNGDMQKIDSAYGAVSATAEQAAANAQAAATSAAAAAEDASEALSGISGAIDAAAAAQAAAEQATSVSTSALTVANGAAATAQGAAADAQQALQVANNAKVTAENAQAAAAQAVSDVSSAVTAAEAATTAANNASTAASAATTAASAATTAAQEATAAAQAAAKNLVADDLTSTDFDVNLTPTSGTVQTLINSLFNGLPAGSKFTTGSAIYLYRNDNDRNTFVKFPLTDYFCDRADNDKKVLRFNAMVATGSQTIHTLDIQMRSDGYSEVHDYEINGTDHNITSSQYTTLMGNGRYTNIAIKL